MTKGRQGKNVRQRAVWREKVPSSPVQSGPPLAVTCPELSHNLSRQPVMARNEESSLLRGGEDCNLAVSFWHRCRNQASIFVPDTQPIAAQMWCDPCHRRRAGTVLGCRVQGIKTMKPGSGPEQRIVAWSMALAVSACASRWISIWKLRGIREVRMGICLVPQWAP